MSDGKKAIFRIKKLEMWFRLVQTQESYVNDSKSVGLGTTNPAFFPFTQTKIRSYLCVKEISSFNWTNCIRGVIPHQVIVAFVDHQAYTGNYQKKSICFWNFRNSKNKFKGKRSKLSCNPIQCWLWKWRLFTHLWWHVEINWFLWNKWKRWSFEVRIPET